MPLHRFDGAQMQQQYGLSEGTQIVQTTYSIQPMPVHDEGSLALGRTQTYSAVFGTAGESGTRNLVLCNRLWLGSVTQPELFGS